jgi:hypothetical protein
MDIIDNSNITDTNKNVFWLNDITTLYKDKKYLQFIPNSSMTRIEQLNSITRFCIYLLILFLLFDDRSDNWILLPIIGIIFMIILFNIFNIDIDGKYKELARMRQIINSDTNLPDNINYRTYKVDLNGETKIIDIDAEEQHKYNEQLDNNDTNYILESGQYDSQGNINSDTYYGPLSNKQKLNDIKYSLDEMRLYEKNNQLKPTSDNPFMNPSVNDFNSENITVPANSDDKDIQNDAEIKFNDDIYKDFQDVFNKKNSQRQFFTVAHNVPNDQEAFARWCYKFPPTCKTQQEKCLRYEDLRFK